MADELQDPRYSSAGAWAKRLALDHDRDRELAASTGLVPYGPSRTATDSLSHIMAADLAGAGVTVNLIAPGGATATGMIPDEVGEDVRAGLLDLAIMGHRYEGSLPPIPTA